MRVIVGNNKILSDTIHNYSTNPYRRIELTTEISASLDPQAAIRRIRARVEAIPHVVPAPAPAIAIQRIAEGGAVVCVQPSTQPEHYSDAMHATNRAIAEVGAELGWLEELPGLPSAPQAA